MNNELPLFYQDNYLNIWEENVENKIKSTISALPEELDLIDKKTDMPFLVAFSILNEFKKEHLYSPDGYHFSVECLSNYKQDLSSDYLPLFKSLMISVPNILDSLQKVKKQYQIAIKKSLRDQSVREELLNAYVEISQGAYFELLKIYASFEEKKNGKKLIKLGSLGATQSNLNSISIFKDILDIANYHIRNAKDHGDARVLSNKYVFTDGHEGHRSTFEIPVFDFKYQFENLLSFACGAIYHIIEQMVLNNIDILSDSDLSKNWKKIILSSLNLRCDGFENIHYLDSNGKDATQTNVNFSTTQKQVPAENKKWFMLCSSIKAFHFNEQSNRVCIFVSCPDSLDSFASFSKSEIQQSENDKKNFSSIYKSADIDNGAIWQPNSHESGNAIGKIIYQDIQVDNFTIQELDDISTENTKQFKARVILNGNLSKFLEHKNDFIKQFINHIKVLPNAANPKYKIKYGSMEADDVSLWIYNSEANIDRHITYIKSSSNPNFVCTLEYNKDRDFILMDNFDKNVAPSFDLGLKEHNVNLIQERWNENYLE